MQTETPYRTSTASSLELRIIELGYQLENLEENSPDLHKFYTETTSALRQFGYKKIYHRDLMNNDSSIACLNYYNLAKRLVVFDLLKIKEDTGLIGFGHDDYYTKKINIYYIDKCDIVEDIATLNSIPKRLRNIFFPGLFENKDRLIAVKCIGSCSTLIRNFRSFLTMF